MKIYNVSLGILVAQGGIDKLIAQYQYAQSFASYAVPLVFIFTYDPNLGELERPRFVFFFFDACPGVMLVIAFLCHVYQ